MAVSTALPEVKRSPLRQSLRTSLIAAFVTALLLLFLVGGGNMMNSSIQPIALPVGAAFAVLGWVATFAILRSGKVNTARLILFIGVGLFFGIAFTLDHEINRGSILLTQTQFSSNEVPICPITLPFVVIPLAIRGQMIFPASVTALAGVGLLWLSFVLLFGRGWCSWLCFFGGIDQACAAALKKPLIRIKGLNRVGRLFPYAFSLFLILVAVGGMYPLFCAWLCPLRIVYDPPVVSNTVEWLSAIVFVMGGTVLLIGGPLLTKKRLFCGMVCPLLPINALVGKLSPFRVTVDKEKCNDCGACTQACETLAMTESSLAKGEAALECSRCGKCMDACPKHAIDYRLIGTRISIRPVFVSLAVTFSLLMTSSFVVALLIYARTGHINFLGR